MMGTLNFKGGPILGNQIGQALCDALGLPNRTASFTLRVRADHIVTVECEYYPTDGDGLVKALAEYTLERRSQTEVDQHPAAALGFDVWMERRKAAEHESYMDRMRYLPHLRGQRASMQ